MLIDCCSVGATGQGNRADILLEARFSASLERIFALHVSKCLHFMCARIGAFCEQVLALHVSKNWRFM
jgi:hypothetical protein